jgi:protease-4
MSDDPSRQPADSSDPAGRPPVSTGPLTDPPPPPPGYLPPAYPAAPPQKGVVSKVLTSLLATLVLLSIGLNIYLGIFYFAIVAGSATEAEYRAGAGEQRVVIVPVEGGIDDDMAEYVRKAFKSLEKNVPAAVVLRVNSGGGGVTASDQIWQTIHSFKQEHPDVTVVASLGGVAASGGYYIAAPADLIFCEQTGITGSIGVMAQIPAVEEMIDKLGVEMNVVVADGSREKAIANNLFEDWKNEAGQLTEAGEKNQEVLKNLLNSAWARFVEVVDEGRPTLSREQAEALATGEVFTASEALDAELIDEIGYLDDAIDKAIEMAGLDPDDGPPVTIIRESGGGLLGLLGASAAPTVRLSDLSPDAVRTWLEDVGQVRLAYRLQIQ